MHQCRKLAGAGILPCEMYLLNFLILTHLVHRGDRKNLQRMKLQLPTSISINPYQWRPNSLHRGHSCLHLSSSPIPSYHSPSNAASSMAGSPNPAAKNRNASTKRPPVCLSSPLPQLQLSLEKTILSHSGPGR